MTIPAISSSSLPVATPLLPYTKAAATSGVSFSDVLDAVNPLQHIPVVSSLYRAVTGSTIASGAQIAGDTIYGGLLGGAIASFVSSAADVAVKEASGKSISEQVVTALAPTSAAATPTPTVTDASSSSSTIFQTESKKIEAQQKVDQALINMLHPGAHTAHAAGQYKRAHALDTTNQMLMRAL